MDTRENRGREIERSRRKKTGYSDRVILLIHKKVWREGKGELYSFKLTWR